MTMNLETIKQKLLRKIYRAFEKKNNSPFNWQYDMEYPKSNVLEVSRSIRGLNKPPAIILNGVTRRSGTNFIGELLGLHPNICSYPGNLFEVPFLGASNFLIDFHDAFLNGFRRNREQLGNTDLLPLFGSAFIAYLYSFVPDNKQILIKVSNVKYLWNFPYIFPHEKLILLQRDGRDVVASNMASWKDNDFHSICTRWKKSQDIILKFKEKADLKRVCFVNYEDAVNEPKRLVKRVLSELEMNETLYPYDKIDNLPVKGSSAIRIKGKLTWEDVEKPEAFNPIGRWSIWDNKQKRIFKQICGDTLIKSGYAENLNW